MNILQQEIIVDRHIEKKESERKALLRPPGGGGGGGGGTRTGMHVCGHTIKRENGGRRSGNANHASGHCHPVASKNANVLKR